jgi:predicted O-methyltransferase YrrM
VSYEDAVRIDDCHIDLIYGLAVSQKPNSILELGWGSGRSAKAIIKAIKYNGNYPRYTIVDNWMDFNGKIPKEAAEIHEREALIITSEEESFIRGCKFSYDFILSDADHCWSHLWFEQTFDNVLRSGGIMVCHDIMNRDGYPRLYDIVVNCQNRGIRHAIFDKNSRNDERCERGLLVIFKD